MSSNLVQLDFDKNRIIVMRAPANRQEISFKLSQLLMESVTQVRNLGVIMDANLTLKSHIIKTEFNH